MSLSLVQIWASRAGQAISDKLGYKGLNNLAEGDAKYDPKYGYINTMRLLEGGFRPELVGKQLEMFETAEGGDAKGIIERIRQAYGFNYETATQLYQSWEGHKGDWESYAKGAGKNSIEKFGKDPGSYDSVEMKLLVVQEKLANTMSSFGQNFTDLKLKGIESLERGVWGIYYHLIGKKEFKNLSDGLFSSNKALSLGHVFGDAKGDMALANRLGNERGAEKNFKKMIENAQKNGQFSTLAYASSVFEGMSEADKKWMDNANISNLLLNRLGGDKADLGEFMREFIKVLEAHRESDTKALEIALAKNTAAIEKNGVIEVETK